MKLNDLFSTGLLDEMVVRGYVTAREHPDPNIPYVVYNYTKGCAYERNWNECTIACRGLIATSDSQIVARPFSKFFNHGEPNAPTLDLHARARVTDKVDGSLGVLYVHNGSYGIATRGSFESDQALVGTHLLQKYIGKDGWLPDTPKYTYLFEIVYPENRIVIDYGDTRDLILLTVLDTETGANVTDTAYWPGPRTDSLAYDTLAKALAAPPRQNSEGVVVEVDGQRIKIKQDDYVALHRLVTGLNERTVWELIGSGKTYKEICAEIPEEFHEWINEVTTDLTVKAGMAENNAYRAFERVLYMMPLNYTRKDFALYAQRPEFAEFRPLLFLILDGKSIRDPIWKTLRPSAYRTPRDWGTDE